MLLACSLSACVTPPAQTASFVPGAQAEFEGRVVSVDTTPWAYDGNAVVMVATGNTGIVQVQLPARWNLCQAEPPGDVQAFKPDDRVQVAGTFTEAGTVVVCEQPRHHLRKME
ncbi:hypothetical protein ASD14_12170 [Lysobacter sp. Root494]|nr:hypothetical protein ASD14_12170 [Lysobacter sp. Root494]